MRRAERSSRQACGIPSLSLALAVLFAVGTVNAADLQLHHIHGLALTPGEPVTLYIATHAGLVKGTNDRDWQFVGDDRADFMGFTVHSTVPGLMVASGHPAEGSHGPNPRGIIVSRDAGRTWRPLALEGRADFHALTLSGADGDTLYGWNVGSNPGLYRVSLQNGTWSPVEARGLGEVYALSAHPTERDTVVAGTRSGLLVSRDGGRSWEPLAGALQGVQVTAVAFGSESPPMLYAYAVHEELGLVKSPDGATWIPTGVFLGRADAVSHIVVHRTGTVYLATFRSHISRSTDGGRSWAPLFQQGRPVQSR